MLAETGTENRAGRSGPGAAGWEGKIPEEEENKREPVKKEQQLIEVILCHFLVFVSNIFL